ncbi:MAG: hypothetical protein AAFU85_29055 [Planctomycetota bacterium]
MPRNDGQRSSREWSDAFSGEAAMPSTTIGLASQCRAGVFAL